MAVLTITWHTMKDVNVCPICQPLEAYQWAFDTRYQQFPEFLVGPQGAVWDATRDRPMTHELIGIPHRCRCHLTWTMDASDEAERIRMLRMMAEERVEE